MSDDDMGEPPACAQWLQGVLEIVHDEIIAHDALQQFIDFCNANNAGGVSILHGQCLRTANGKHHVTLTLKISECPNDEHGDGAAVDDDEVPLVRH